MSANSDPLGQHDPAQAPMGTGPEPESLWTDWSRSFGLQVPILNAPMGGVAGGVLAAAVSKAGGLGMVGVGSAGTVEFLREQTSVPSLAGIRFGVGLLAWAVQNDPGLLDAAICAGPSLISVSFGNEWWWVDRVHDAGIATATQVYDVDSAREAYEAGVDILVARGSEGGGHGIHRVSTLVLLQGVMDAVPATVLAAGGIASARGLAAVLAAGASGVWLGTPFLACPESLATDAVRALVLKARGEDTVQTRIFDIALGYPWPPRFDERVLRNDVTDRWCHREDELARDPQARIAVAGFVELGGPATAVVDAGQGVGLVTDVRPAAAVIGEMASGAAALLAAWALRHQPGCSHRNGA